MKIIALPDLHSHSTGLAAIGPALAKVDSVLLVGDLTNGGSATDARQIVETVRKFNPSILAIPGNWDTPEVEAYLSEEGINLHCRYIVIEHLALIGIGASLPGIIRTPNEIDESDFEQIFRDATTDLDPDISQILVCHQPPYNTINDLIQQGTHVGSREVRKFIERCQPLVCFTGHIHEGVGIDQVGRTKIVNPGPITQGSYAYAEVTSLGLQTLEIMRVASQ